MEVSWYWKEKNIEKRNLKRKKEKVMNYGEFGGQYVPQGLKVRLNELEGIIPALESSHAIAYALKIAKKYDKDDCIIVNLSGRGDKDVEIILGLGEIKNE